MRNEMAAVPAGAISAAEAPTVVFLHGRGGSELDVDGVRRSFGEARLFAPRGRLDAGSGYAWFQNLSPGIADQESLRTEVLALETVLDAQVSYAKPWLCGFSSGAAMAAALLLSRPERYRGGLLLSGPIVNPQPWPRDRLRGLAVLMVYGAGDHMIPRELLQKSSEYLTTESGAQASLQVLAGGHEISAAKLRLASEWFARQTSPALPAAPLAP
jgi:phospholipase/carboxylesterase